MKKKIRLILAMIFLAVPLYNDLSQTENISGELYIKTIDVQDLFDDLTNEQIKQTKQLIENPNLEEEYLDVEKSCSSCLISCMIMNC